MKNLDEIQIVFEQQKSLSSLRHVEVFPAAVIMDFHEFPNPAFPRHHYRTNKEKQLEKFFN
jgi:hypothetical protein